MPGLVAFGRRWSVGSDDLFVPSICLGFIQIICLTMSILSLVLDYDEVTKENLDSICGEYLFYKLVGALILLSFGLILTIFLMVVSLRGSILDDRPRKSAQYLIYVLLVVLLLKLTWSGFAVSWIHHFYTKCTVEPTKQIILALVIMTWFVFVSVLVTGWCTFDGAGRSWVKMKRYQANMKEFEQKYPSIYKRSGSRHNRNWRQRKVIRAYQDSWDHRCRLLFCCIHRTDRNRDSFADLARLLSEFFRDLDVVPSDVVVALLLLRRLQRLEQCSIVKQKRNNTYEFLSGVAITSRTKFVAMNEPSDSEIFKNVVHFMHYASAAYGWPWYLLPNGCRGICRLCSNLRCCCGSDLRGVVLEDNCCYCNYAVIPTVFDPGSFDVIFATYHVEVGETPFFVVVDYKKEAVVVSIRGTLSLKDVITDLNAEGETLPVEPRKEDWIGHKGIVAAAVYMKSKLHEGGIIEKAFNSAPERGSLNYRLVLVGHSLGAGTAAILAVLLKEQYPTLQCYAFSPPGGLLSMPVVEFTKEFVISVIVGKDLVPRIGLSQLEALRADLINAMKKSNKPKWQTLMSGMACCCCLKPEFPLPQRLSSAPSIQSEEFMRSRRSLKDLREVTINPNESAISLTVHQPLYPPGRIMHIVRHHPKKDERLLKKEPVFQALWTENIDYGQVLISPGMIEDHMPHQVLQALHRVVTSHGPAKPQRNLTASVSPLILSKESIPDEIKNTASPVRSAKIRKSDSPKRICIETSFANYSSSKATPCSVGVGSSCTLMNPSPHIVDADAEECDMADDGDLTPTNPESLHNVLSSLNLSWDYVTSLQDEYLERESLHQFIHDPNHPPQLPFPYSHEQRSTNGYTSSSCCSDDAGSTFKEIFGTIKYEDWMAPLASPETLSEISSLGSRASFFVSKDQSPLLRIKNGRQSSNASLQRQYGSLKNGKGQGQAAGGNGVHHRSFSCTYPEVSIIGSVLCHDHATTKVNGRHNGDVEALLEGNFDEASPTHFRHHTFKGSYSIDGDGEGQVFDPSESNQPRRMNGNGSGAGDSMKRVSFNLKKKFGARNTDPLTQGQQSTYEPTYPIFSHQAEYGVPSLNSPHYTYCGQSPVDSPDVVFATPQPCLHAHGAHGPVDGKEMAVSNTESCQRSNTNMFTFPEFGPLGPSLEKFEYQETHH